MPLSNEKNRRAPCVEKFDGAAGSIDRSPGGDESPLMPNEPLHVPSEAATPFRFREHTFRFLATAEETGGTYSTMEILSPRETGPRPHVHEDAEESFFLLDGEVEFDVNGTVYLVRPGDFVHVPRRTLHHFRVVSETARMLASYAPGGEERDFIEAATPLR
jgi:quercetin dioxygenase-like cupin family protein